MHHKCVMEIWSLCHLHSRPFFSSPASQLYLVTIVDEEKKEEEKRGGKEGKFAFFSGQVRQCMGDHILCAYYHVGHK